MYACFKKECDFEPGPHFLLFIHPSRLYGTFEEVKGFVASGEFRKIDKNGISRRKERIRKKLIHTEALNLKNPQSEMF